MKTYFKIWFIFFLLVCLNELSLAQSNVWISGQLNDQQEGTIEIINDCFVIFPFTIIASIDVEKSGNFHFKFNITKPQVIQLFNKTFYITPGDSVFANVIGSRFKTKEIEFKGRNANPYIYAMKYDSLKRSLRFKCYEYDFKNGLSNYLYCLNVNKTILLNYLNDFSDIHILTDKFKTYALSQIVYEYYNQLLYPFVNKNFPVGQIPSAYTSILDRIKLTDDSLADKREYVFTAMNLLIYKKLKYNGNELQLINDNSTGLTKDLLLTNYANSLIFSYTSKDSLVTKELFKKINMGVINPEFRNYFNPLKEQLNKYLTPFPKEVLLTALIDSIGHKLSFSDLLRKSKNKFIVIDFWASWCGPCKVGMPKVDKLKKIFSNADVEFVFISLDETENDWRDGMKNTNIPGSHYWIDDNFKSALAKYLIVHSIPRYVIINKIGTIEKFNAFDPEPGDYGLQSQLSKLLSY